MGHGFDAVGRMCPLPRSLAAEANGCFMVRTPRGSNRIQGCGARFARHGGLPSVCLLAASPGAAASQCVTVTEVRAMPRGRAPDGEHALSNAERQARYRARHLMQPAPVATRIHRPIDRRSRPSVGATRSSNCLRCRPSMPIGSRHCPTACATAPLPTHSRPSSISISLPLPTSSHLAATAVTELHRTGASQPPLRPSKNRLTPKAPYKAHHCENVR